MRASVAAAARHARRRELRSLSLDSANTSSSSRFNTNDTNRGFYSFLGPTIPAFQQTQEVADSSPSFSGSNTKMTESSSATKTSSTVSQLDFNKLVKQPEGTESPMKFYERLADEGVLQRDEKQVKALHVFDTFYHKVMWKDSSSSSSNSSSSSSTDMVTDNDSDKF